jgi:chloramphenicol 3-O-phosphotransferase
MKVYVILAAVYSDVSRRDLEYIAGQEYESLSDVKEAVYQGSATKGVIFLSIDEFMERFNDEDCDMAQEYRIDIETCWFGYVKLKN